MLNRISRVVVCNYPIDMRKGFNSLLAIAQAHNLEPQNGDLLIFGGRNRRRVKILHGDRTGVWLSIKVFTEEEAMFRMRFLESGIREISVEELRWLLSGLKESTKAA